ncbi:hypothetical protein [Blastopirellula marina]|uniref:Glutamine amidotransferase domain-containing protein n=1 Tax=Blastopirellula marina TaxID=124 RepID=A0A2S8GKU4_9BACT|nr:hypothetical protein [Blastopirellula marina]PQO45075.1 hypothetical protein C5Y93_16205 [Blastopirellula marina]
MTETLGWLLNIRNASSIDHVQVSLAAPWASGNAFWVILGCAAALAASLWFYAKFHRRLGGGARYALGATRGLLLALLIFTLADPILQVTATNDPEPVVYAVFDGTESMTIADDLPVETREALAAVVGLQTQGSSAALGASGSAAASRAQWLQAYLQNPNGNLLTRLAEERGVQVEPFIFDGQNTSRLRRLLGEEENEDATEMADAAVQLTTEGRVTALGDMLHDLSTQHRTSRLASVLLFSDFAQNAGAPPLNASRGGMSPVERVGAPIYTIGLGVQSAVDIAVDVQPPPKMKKAERATIAVRVNQSGLTGETVDVNVYAEPLEGDSLTGMSRIPVGTATLTLDSSVMYVDMPFTPEQAGRFAFIAEIEPQIGEATLENNTSVRAVNIIDDYLRLMFVENEPTWEWRFVKEVFHRDRLVGMRGFRTFLRSADPKVRQNNELFLPTLTPQRSEFFANDVIFLGDMPGNALSDRFCEMTKEFVGQFGGGLVVIAGPRFGPSQLNGTPLADMLPVKVDGSMAIRDDKEFDLRLTPLGLQTDFMQLGETADARDNAEAWKSLGKLPWYQPVQGVHSQATVLAEHPFDLCSDGKTPQPLIAIRRYGAGEVVYVSFNELWRLRRLHGEKYYRQFWSQLINRLGLSHALGAQKRFVVRAERDQYLVDEKALISVEAYDENFEPLSAATLPGGALQGEIETPDDVGRPLAPREIAIPELRTGRFEIRVPISRQGQYVVRVKDPVTDKVSEVRFQATGASAELRSAVRNVSLQNEIAQQSGGLAVELEEVESLLDKIELKDVREEVTRNEPLWGTPLWFVLVVGLMLGEWYSRKRANLA